MVDESFLQPIACALGQSMVGNPTQFMMERALAAAGLEWRFLTVEVSADALIDALRGIRAMGFRGASIFSPHTRAAATWVDERSPLASRSELVTCLVRKQGAWYGDDTNAVAFLRTMEALGGTRGKGVWMLGAGSVAQSVGAVLAVLGAERLTLVNRNTARATQLAEKLGAAGAFSVTVAPWNIPLTIPDDAHVLINATPLGEHEHSSVPVITSALRSDMVVVDFVWSPWRTEWVRRAQEQRCRVVDGLTLFVYQIAAAFELWTGQQPDVRLLRESAEEYLDI